MISQPILINNVSFQQTWKDAVNLLAENDWELRNLIVHVTDPTGFDEMFHDAFSRFCTMNSLLGPKDVAYTIFPHKLYEKRGDAVRLFDSYNRKGGLYERLRRRPRRGWGTYFHRMTNYDIRGETQNQLKNIIDAINTRDKTYKAAYTIVIQKPGGETVRPLGGPCLNYIAVQMQRQSSGTTLGLLSVYRNHDFLKRAYGNYWGLCNLICFLSRETGSMPGPLTCVSSRAYVDRKKNALSDFLGSI